LVVASSDKAAARVNAGDGTARDSSVAKLRWTSAIHGTSRPEGIHGTSRFGAIYYYRGNRFHAVDRTEWLSAIHWADGPNTVYGTSRLGAIYRANRLHAIDRPKLLTSVDWTSRLRAVYRTDRLPGVHWTKTNYVSVDPGAIERHQLVGDVHEK
jgi:hypothetical protein